MRAREGNPGGSPEVGAAKASPCWGVRNEALPEAAGGWGSGHQCTPRLGLQGKGAALWRRGRELGIFPKN